MRSGYASVMGLMVGILLTATAVAAQDQVAIDQGKALYLKYCSACHGESGKGDGVVSQLMQPKPPDLTMIAAENGGRFPFYETMLQISGRSATSEDQDASLPGMPKAHGDPAMPVWGEIFSREELSKGSALDLHLQTTGKIMLITEYLQSIQAKGK